MCVPSSQEPEPSKGSWFPKTEPIREFWVPFLGARNSHLQTLDMLSLRSLGTERNGTHLKIRLLCFFEHTEVFI